MSKQKKQIMTLCFLLGMNAGAMAQNVQMKLGKVSVKQAIATLKDKSGYSFVYEMNDLDLNKKVDVNATTLSESIQQILNGQQVNYEIKGNTVIVKHQGVTKDQKENATHTVSGIVKDENGLPIIGATVKVRGAQMGVVTDIDGKFSLKTSVGSVLTVSYIGYKTQDIKVQEGGSLNIKLEPESKQLNEVVVTALGIKRSEKALSYNVQKVGNENLTTVKSTNFMNSLNGKIAGININASAAGMGGATRVVMRGPKSITQSNQALYVIDGVPITNTSHGGESSSMYASQPGSEGIADINPEDIESISVLSGPAAAALYGSAAAQGVIMITTKKGKEGKVSVTVSHSSQFANPFIMPEFQNSYINKPGDIKSWGSKTASTYGAYEPKGFFNTGSNIQNNISLTAGTDKNQTYLSVGTTNASGILPNNRYDRYNVTFRNSTSMLNDKLTLDFNFNYINEADRNLTAQGQYFNPLTSVYLFPRGESFDAVRTFELYDATRGIYVQNWNFGDALKMQNPYWVTNRMVRENKKSRYMLSGSLKYKVNDWLDITGRLRYDDASTKQEDKRYASTIDLFAHSKYGYYGYGKINDQSLYGDLMANINKSFDVYSLSANIGGSFSRTKYDLTGYQGGLKAPSNLFTPNAIDYGMVTNDNRPIYDLHKHNINSVFANVELGWKSMLYLTLTGRNDWDSALDGTSNESFFYPSVGASAVVSSMVQLPRFINYLKVRGSWASVGSAISPNITSPWRYTYNPASGTYSTVTYKFPTTFYPERTNSWEAGISARFLNNALTFDVTVYQSNTRKQTFLRSIPPTDGFTQEYIQTGNVRNRGIELAIGYNRNFGDLSWNTSFTYSANRNKIIKLLDDENEVLKQGGLSGAEIILKKGGTMGDVYMTTDFARDAEGNIAVDDKKGVLQTNLNNPLYRGSVLPKANIGFSNEFAWKGFNFGFLITARFGGIVLSQTQAILDSYGVSKASAVARDNGGIAVNGGRVNAESYYSVVGGDNPIWSEYIYSATNARLQEAHIGYTFPKKFLKGAELSLGLTANNLFFIYNKAPFDPEAVASTGTYYQGFDYFMQPSLRTIGFNVKVKF